MHLPVAQCNRPDLWAWKALRILFFCSFLPVLQAQQPVQASATTVRPAVIDTSPLYFTLALSPEREHPADDTLADKNFRFYDPARQQAVDWGTLGNLGTPARPLFFETMPRQGFDVGVHNFDLYNLKPSDLRFYRNSRSFSDVFFSQGRTQLESMMNARLAHTFSGGTNFSLDYRTINNLGQYRYQRAKHNALLLGLWIPVGERYDGFLIFSKNVNRQQDNGGIVPGTVFGTGDFTGPINAEVNLPELKAYTRHDDQTLQWVQHLRFAGNQKEGKRVLRATHTIDWRKQTWKFYDGDDKEGVLADSTFFDTFLVDLRGIRNYIALDRIDNAFTINTFKSKKPGKPSDELSVGILHSYFNLRQEPEKTAFSNVFLTGQLGISPSEGFVFTADAALGVLKNIGEYRLSGNLILGLGKAGVLKASVLSQRYPVPLLARQLFVSQRSFWSNSFEKPLENTLSGSYALPLIGFEATLKTHLISNYIFYDQQGLATQTTSPLQVAQLLISENVRLGALHFDNTVALQRFNRSDIVHLPEWFSKNSLYFSGKIFKKRMLLETGVDFRINSAFQPDAYQPLTWQFHLQDSTTQKPYTWLDAFLSFKVQTFRFFFRYENLQTLWNKSDVFYQTSAHPQPFGAIRLGISWRFMDSNVAEPGANPGTPTGIGPTPQRRN